MAFPTHRPRRLRRSEALRRMVRETELHPGDFIYPLFVVEGRGVRKPVPSMPGIDNLSVDLAVEEAKRARSVGVPAVILFGIPGHKDPRGTGAWAEDGIVQKALRALKDSVPELQLIADVCLCEYTDHGHCGVIHGGDVDNDQSLPLLAQMAVSCARAGADIVAPSDMMDGRVRAIRTALDEAKLGGTPILSYAAKYASGFYGPFREALKEVALDLEEGADMVMVKPALSYLDVISRVKARFDVPVAAYNVSGEYAMLKAAAANGWIDGQRVMMEILTSIKRAGADLILTYHAVEAAELLDS